MSDDWIELVRKGRAPAKIVAADAVFVRTRRAKVARVVCVMIGEGVLKRLAWNEGERFQVRVSRDGRKLLLIEEHGGSWTLKKPKTRTHMRLTIGIPEVVRDINPGASALYEVDERGGTLTIALPVAAKARAA